MSSVRCQVACWIMRVWMLHERRNRTVLALPKASRIGFVSRISCSRLPSALPGRRPTNLRRSAQHAACNAQHAACNAQRATCNAQHAACNAQHAACNAQHATRNMQHATRNAQHATRNMQRAAEACGIPCDATDGRTDGLGNRGNAAPRQASRRMLPRVTSYRRLPLLSQVVRLRLRGCRRCNRLWAVRCLTCRTAS